MRFPYHGAGIGLILNDSILVGKRSKSPFKDQWSVPGGSAEKGLDKNALETAMREFLEETGVDFKTLDAKAVCSWTLKVPFFSWTTFFYTVDSFSAELKPDEFSVLCWVPLKEILRNTDKKKHFRPFTKSEVRCVMDSLSQN